MEALKLSTGTTNNPNPITDIKNINNEVEIVPTSEMHKNKEKAIQIVLIYCCQYRALF